MAPVVMVSGAAGGIGGATARRFASGGWGVALADRDAAGLAALAGELGEAGVGPFVLDVSDVAACRIAPITGTNLSIDFGLSAGV